MNNLSATKEQLKNILKALSLYKGRLDNKVLAKICELTSFVDAEYYNRQYLDVKSANMEPCVHYVQFGFREGRMPNAVLAETIKNVDAPVNDFVAFIYQLDMLCNQMIEATISRKRFSIFRQGSYASLYGMPFGITILPLPILQGSQGHVWNKLYSIL